MKRFPTTDQAKQAWTEVTYLGLRCGLLAASAAPSAARQEADGPAGRLSFLVSSTLPLATYEDLAKMIDHSLVKPELTDEQVVAGSSWRSATTLPASRAPVRYRAGRANAAGEHGQAGSVAGFPHGSQTTAAKLYETRDLLRRGASEIDMVIAISKLLSREFQHVQTELLQMAELLPQGRRAAKSDSGERIAHRRAEDHRLPLLRRAGVDFVETSTGFAPSGYTSKTCG